MIIGNPSQKVKKYAKKKGLSCQIFLHFTTLKSEITILPCMGKLLTYSKTCLAPAQDLKMNARLN